MTVNTTSFPANLTSPMLGLTPDATAHNGMVGAIANLGAMLSMEVVALAIGSLTTVTMTSWITGGGIVDISGSPGGGVTLTIPTGAQMAASMPATAPKDGTLTFMVMAINDGTGQTITITTATGVTLLGTMTIANNTTRTFFVAVNLGAQTYTVMNCGSMSL